MTRNQIESVILDFLREPMLAWEADYVRMHGRRFDDMLGLLPPATPGARLLDVGIFPGHFAALAQQRGYAVDGIGNEEMTERFLKCAQRAGFGISRTDVETDPFPMADNTYQVVVCAEILEHLYRDPFHLLSEAFRVLAPGGVLILSTPNLAWYRNIFQLMKGRSHRQALDRPIDETFPLNLNYGHFREYTMSELGYLLRGQDKRQYRFIVDKRCFSTCWDDETLALAARRITHPRWFLLTLRNYFVSRLIPAWRSSLMVRAHKPELATWIAPDAFGDVTGFGPVETDIAETGFARRRLASPYRWTTASAEFSFPHPVRGRGAELRLRCALLAPESSASRNVRFSVNGEMALAYAINPSKNFITISLPLSAAARAAGRIRIRIETDGATERGIMLAWERLLLLEG